MELPLKIYLLQRKEICTKCYVSIVLFYVQVVLDRRKWTGGETALNQLANMPIQDDSSQVPLLIHTYMHAVVFT